MPKQWNACSRRRISSRLYFRACSFLRYIQLLQHFKIEQPYLNTVEMLVLETLISDPAKQFLDLVRGQLRNYYKHQPQTQSAFHAGEVRSGTIYFFNDRLDAILS